MIGAKRDSEISLANPALSLSFRVERSRVVRGSKIMFLEREGLTKKFLIVFFASALALSPQNRSAQVEWPYYGGDPGNSKYSQLTDINPAKDRKSVV